MPREIWKDEKDQAIPRTLSYDRKILLLRYSNTGGVLFKWERHKSKPSFENLISRCQRVRHPQLSCQIHWPFK